MKEVEAYEAVDGTLFSDSQKALDHDLDCIGREFDGLLLTAIQATGGHITRQDQHNMCLHLLNNRAAVRDIIHRLSYYLQSEQVTT
jgi:hypothetical protein